MVKTSFLVIGLSLIFGPYSYATGTFEEEIACYQSLDRVSYGPRFAAHDPSIIFVPTGEKVYIFSKKYS